MPEMLGMSLVGVLEQFVDTPITFLGAHGYHGNRRWHCIQEFNRKAIPPRVSAEASQ